MCCTPGTWFGPKSVPPPPDPLLDGILTPLLFEAFFAGKGGVLCVEGGQGVLYLVDFTLSKSRGKNSSSVAAQSTKIMSTSKLNSSQFVDKVGLCHNQCAN